MTRRRAFLWLVAFVAVGVLWWWSGRRPQTPAPIISSTPAAPVARQAPLVVAPPLPPARESLVDARYTDYNGKNQIVVIRSASRDSMFPEYSVYAVDSVTRRVRRMVDLVRGPWPDFVLRIDSVSPDSVYLKGTSAAYHRTVSRVAPWTPLNVGPAQPNLGRPAVALSAPACGATVLVDLNARTIAGIWMNQSIDDLMREVGATNVIPDSGAVVAEDEEGGGEGGSSTGYIIKLCGHQIRRAGNGVSWTDRVFRTAEGLGVGSPLAAFDSVHGTGEASAEEGFFVRYWPINGIGHFFVDVSSGCYRFPDNRHVEVDRSCRATGISMIIFSH